MKNILILFVAVATIFGCAKDDGVDNTVNDTFTISDIKLDRSKIGLGQAVTFSIEQPTHNGVLNYKWEVVDPNGGKVERLEANKNTFDYLASLKGNYVVNLVVSSDKHSVTKTTTFTTVETDLFKSIFGDSKDVVIRTKAFDNIIPVTGHSSEMFWPYSSPKPTDVLVFNVDGNYEKYLYQDNKLVAVSFESSESDHIKVENSVSRNVSYILFAEMCRQISQFSTGSPNIVINWRPGITEVEKLQYENNYPTKEQGYGYALMNGDALSFSASLSFLRFAMELEMENGASNSKFIVNMIARLK